MQNFRVEIDMPHFPSLLNLDKVHVAAFPISSFFFLRQHDVERTWALKSDVSASRSHSPFIQPHDPGELVTTAVLCEAGIVTAALPARETDSWRQGLHQQELGLFPVLSLHTLTHPSSPTGISGSRAPSGGDGHLRLNLLPHLTPSRTH